ncbi:MULTISPECIES: hypothetical protein [unclassified Thioalkalivibrio]|uniref:hypothetical protein n=1 Tax=unclassified Thioalkalivibrio TaxID=2621013 RepID=UPI00035FB04D|nr:MULTISPECIES: hypothetical protein [unclassified Thioalkalivibrio]
MVKIVRIVLKVATLVALAVSSVIFVWFLAWVFWLANDYFSPDQGLNQLFDEASQRFAREQGLSEEEFMGARLLFEARSLFAALAGLWGWIALYAGAFMMNRPFGKVPLAIKMGLVAGILASLAIPSTGITLAKYPIITAMLLFTIWWLNTSDAAAGKGLSEPSKGSE